MLQGQVPYAPVNTIAQALQEPHVDAREMIISVPHPHWGEIKEIACPIKVSGYQPPARPGPALGADTEAVLHELLGLTPAEVAAYRQRGAI